MKLIAKRRWLTFRQLHRERIRHLLTQADQQLFDSDFFKDLGARRLELEKSYWKVVVFASAIIGFLALRFAGQTEISLLGLVIRHPEPLIMVLALLSVVGEMQRNQIDRIKITLDEFARVKAGAGGAYYYKLRWSGLIGDEVHFQAPEGHTSPGVAIRVWAYLYVGTVILTVAIYVAVSIGIQIITFVGIWRTPSLGPLVSYVVLTFALCANAFVLMMLVGNYVPMPYTDYTVSNELAELRESDPAAHDVKMTELIRQANEGRKIG